MKYRGKGKCLHLGDGEKMGVGKEKVGKEIQDQRFYVQNLEIISMS